MVTYTGRGSSNALRGRSSVDQIHVWLLGAVVVDPDVGVLEQGCGEGGERASFGNARVLWRARHGSERFRTGSYDLFDGLEQALAVDAACEVVARFLRDGVPLGLVQTGVDLDHPARD